MNPTFSSPRNGTTAYTGSQNSGLYAAQNKESNGQTFTGPGSKPMPSFLNQPGSLIHKKFTAKHPLEGGKSGSNSSAYLKSTIESNAPVPGYHSKPANNKTTG